MFQNISMKRLDLICEKDMVAAKICFKMIQSGECNKIVIGKIIESWGH